MGCAGTAVYRQLWSVREQMPRHRVAAVDIANPLQAEIERVLDPQPLLSLLLLLGLGNNSGGIRVDFHFVLLSEHRVSAVWRLAL